MALCNMLLREAFLLCSGMILRHFYYYYEFMTYVDDGR